MRPWLVRRGETKVNVTGLYSGHAPAPLTGRGIIQVQTLGTLLRNIPANNVLYSELERAYHTTQLILGDHEAPVRNMSELNEMFSGDWEIRHHRDLAREDVKNYAVWCNDWQSATPTNGESFQAFSQCMERFIAQLADYKTCQGLLVVSHQGVLNVLIARLPSMPAAAMWHFRVEQGYWSVIDLCNDFAVLKILNNRTVWRDEEWEPCFFCRGASLPLTPHDRPLFSAVWLFPLFKALQKLFYKNDDTFYGVGWGDNALQKRFRKHLSRYRLWFKYTDKCF